MPNADQMPWEEEPYQDRKAATERAIAGATWSAPGLITDAQRHYAEKVFRDEIETLERTGKGSRNDQLNKSAFALAQLVAAGALDETSVRDALAAACRVNQHWQEDGSNMVLGTIESGFEDGLAKPRNLSHVTGSTNSHILENESVVSSPTIDDIEAGFWTKRESLKNVYLTSLSRMCPPWAVLAHVAARVLTLVPPHQTLPPLIGGQGSLNWFCAIAAASGSGKSSAGSVAKLLVDEMVMVRNLGSGEGFVDAYVKPADKETGEPAGQHESIMFLADEIDTLAALGLRSGSTLSGILRSAFSGETVGFTYRTASSRHLAAHSYRMTLVANVQPGKAGTLLDDEHGGMLQRFMWFPGEDKRISSKPPLDTGPLTLPAFFVWKYPRELKIPYSAKYLILQERAKQMRGDQYHLDGHALFIREKFAYALAVIDGRDEMNEEDWRLAGTAVRVSDHTRERVTAQLRRLVEDQASERGRLQGVSSTAADEEKSFRASQRINRIGTWALKKIAGQKYISPRELNHALTSRDRPYLPAALDLLQTSGLIKLDDQKRWMRTGG